MVSPLWPAGCFCVNDRLADKVVELEAVWAANTRTPYQSQAAHKHTYTEVQNDLITSNSVIHQTR